MDLYLQLALGGVPIGAMYALQALGIVLVYKTSRVFTFATGAVGMTCAYVASSLDGLPVVLTLLVSVAVGVGLGLLMELSTRPVRGTLPRTVVTLGWLLGLQGLVGLGYGTQTGVHEPSRVFPSGGVDLGVKRFSVEQVGVVLVTVALVALLALFFRRTALGTATRAVSEAPDAARLLGIGVGRVNLVAWGIGGGVAGLAGVLVTPLLGSLDTTTLTIFSVQALAAALVGRLSSLPLTLVGGVGLGMLQPVVSGALTRHGHSQRGTDELLALLVVLLSLLAFRRTGRRDVAAGGLAPMPVKPLPRGLTAVAAVVGVALGGLLVPLLVDDVGNLSRVTVAQTAVWGIAVLSLVLLVGVVGQVSVCPGGFMAVGAFGTGISLGHDVPFLLALLVGALLASAVAALVGLPAVRLEPLELAIATLSLSFTADRFLYSWAPLAGSGSNRDVPRPGFAGLSPDHMAAGQRNYAWLVVGLFVLTGFAVASLRRGRTGAALTALRSSEPATSAMGFSVVSVKLRGFAASGFVAGLAGGLYAGLFENASGNAFDFTRSITLLAYAVIVGVASVPGALVGGLVVTVSLLSFGDSASVSDGRAESLSSLVTGILLVAVLAVAPTGLAGLVSKGVARARAGAA